MILKEGKLKQKNTMFIWFTFGYMKKIELKHKVVSPQ